MVAPTLPSFPRTRFCLRGGWLPGISRPPGFAAPSRRSPGKKRCGSTISSAYTWFAEEDQGSIEAGKLAGLVVSSDDIMTLP